MGYLYHTPDGVGYYVDTGHGETLIVIPTQGDKEVCLNKKDLQNLLIDIDVEETNGR